MCLALYLGTNCDLALREGPSLSVRPVSEDATEVLSVFKTRHVYYLGAHTGCSCGFPSVIAEGPIEYYDGMFEDDDDRSSDLTSVHELLVLLDEILGKDGKCTLYPVWSGNESEDPKGDIALHRDQLSETTFVLTEQFLYQIIGEPGHARERPKRADSNGDITPAAP